MTQLSCPMSMPILLAHDIFAGFDAMLNEFLNISMGAQQRFELADWRGVNLSMIQRNSVYEDNVSRVINRAEYLCGSKIKDADIWRAAKNHYADLVDRLDNSLIAQTFFNSVFGSIFGHDKIRDVHVFILDEKYQSQRPDRHEILLTFTPKEDMAVELYQLFKHFELSLPYENIEADIQSTLQVLGKLYPSYINYHNQQEGMVCNLEDDNDIRADQKITIEVVNFLFFRNKAAYIIGRFTLFGVSTPFSFALMNNQEGAIFVDAFIVGEEKLSLIFSFTRAYFMVATDKIVHCVNFLCELMPKKRRFEIFNSIGFVKHAKTEFYRFKVNFTRNLLPDRQYKIAPGIKGMVMLVFTLDESDYVYKVIKDHFSPPKESTRQQVKAKYNMVKNADRVGRMADVYEFSYLAFDRSRFSDELLKEMQKEVASQLQVTGNALVLKHVYVERKMIPLNLYVRHATDKELEEVMNEYGKAIKQLASANIFPGDMLLKNFGVTRHRRVVFYDYDEICPLLDCNFRTVPIARREEDQMRTGAWYDVAPNDVFPEQFSIFFFGNKRAKAVFDRIHIELYSVEYWRRVQKDILEGEVADVFPYRRKWRFIRKYSDTSSTR